MITIIIIVISAVVSISAFRNRDLFFRLRFDPYIVQERNEFWRFLTYGFVHADWMHLFINMFVLYSFGRAVELYFGQIFPLPSFLFILLYIGGLLASVIPSYFKNRENPYYASVGASGAVSAVVFSSMIFNPLAPLYIFPIPFEIPAIIFGILYLIYSAYASKKANDNIGHDAHFWGAIFGVVFTIACKPALVLHFFSVISQAF